MADKLYDSTQLEADRADLTNREQALQTAGDDINRELVSLESAWQGNASQAFLEAAMTWQQGYQQVLAAFNKLNGLLGSASEGFTSAEGSRTTQSTGSWT
jgi:WXG100 family type VII secretion target